MLHIKRSAEGDALIWEYIFKVSSAYWETTSVHPLMLSARGQNFGQWFSLEILCVFSNCCFQVAESKIVWWKLWDCFQLEEVRQEDGGFPFCKTVLGATNLCTAEANPAQNLIFLLGFPLLRTSLLSAEALEGKILFLCFILVFLVHGT